MNSNSKRQQITDKQVISGEILFQNEAILKKFVMELKNYIRLEN